MRAFTVLVETAKMITVSGGVVNSSQFAQKDNNLEHENFIGRINKCSLSMCRSNSTCNSAVYWNSIPQTYWLSLIMRVKFSWQIKPVEKFPIILRLSFKGETELFLQASLITLFK